MSDRRQQYPGHPTRPKDRAQLAPIARAPLVEEPPETRPALEETRARAREAEDGIETLSECPLCRQGLVSREVSATFDRLVAAATEKT